MSPTRIYHNSPLSSAKRYSVDDRQARYLTRALRLRLNDEFTVFDGRGGEYPATIVAVGKRAVEIETGHFVDRDIESPLDICLVQSLSKGDRMDTIVQKATELGVQRIVPVISDHSVVKLDDSRAASRLDHWKKIAISACEQCGRNRLPEFQPPDTLLNWLGANFGGDRTSIMLAPNATKPLTAYVARDAKLTFLIGPEGGFSSGEYERAQAAGISLATLGPRVLRTETAGPTAIAVAQACWGDLSPTEGQFV